MTAYLDNFDSGSLSAWALQTYGNGSGWTAQTDGASGYWLEDRAGFSFNRYAIFQTPGSIDGTTNTTEVVLKWRQRSGENVWSDSQFLAILCFATADGAGGGVNRVGYGCGFFSTTGFGIYRLSSTGSIASTIATATVSAVSDGTWYWIRFRRETDSTFKAKIWADGSSEPGTWTIGTTSADSTYTSGWVGTGAKEGGGEISVDLFGVGINETAPGVGDTTPDAFSFTDQTNVGTSTLITSNTLTVSGIDAASPISVSGGEYQINGGAFTSTAGTISNGDTFAVRHTSSASPGTATNTVLTIGGVSDAFTSTTASLAPTITSADGDNIVVDGQADVAIVGTNLTGATFDLIDGSITVAQNVDSTASTSAQIDIALGNCRYGVRTIRATTGNGTGSRSITIQPGTGRAYVDVTTPNVTAANRLTAIPDVASGDQVEIGNVVGGVIADITLLPDLTFSWSVGVVSFDARANDGTGWSVWATQSVNAIVWRTDRGNGRIISSRWLGGGF